ncbi:MAG: helix-turn-helix domain-containing protein [Synechococcaceae cyanobacterium RM1_1_27]|nr:helix-turn-helix domain-containing protein [Synechococcaceae cyanobacterium SM2_3_2]NJO85686.1 helix-turn-helix domain-containing protein [Synechococcaceae cyanobacterium RM1_1_27]
MTERTYRYRFYSTAKQESLLCRRLGCVRLGLKKTLDLRTQAWADLAVKNMVKKHKLANSIQSMTEISMLPATFWPLDRR